MTTRPLILKKPVVAITGSAGKTTTKEMIASIFMQHWRTFKSSGNANAYWHTAKYAKRITPFYQTVVLEFGMSHPGQIRRHCQIIQPNIGVVTNVGTAHIGNYNGNVRGIANTKSDLIRYMKPTGTLFINADDVNSKLLDTRNFKGKIITVSQKNPASYRAENIQYKNLGMNFQTKLNGRIYEFYIPVLGKHNIYNALFAIAVSHSLGISPKKIEKGLRSFKKPYRRLTVYRLGNGVNIIDDSFSANPNAVKAAIDVLTQNKKRTNIAVLGTMLEMGKYSVIGHKDVGKYLAGKKLDILYTYGMTAKLIGKGAAESGFSPYRIKNFLSREQLDKALLMQMKRNTTILIKGSHGMGMNKTVKALVNNYKRRSINH